MKLTLKTTYEGIDQDWLDWYIQRLDKAGRQSAEEHLIDAAVALSKGGSFQFSNTDPTDPKVRATTVYILTKEGE